MRLGTRKFHWGCPRDKRVATPGVRRAPTAAALPIAVARSGPPPGAIAGATVVLGRQAIVDYPDHPHRRGEHIYLSRISASRNRCWTLGPLGPGCRSEACDSPSDQGEELACEPADLGSDS